MLLSTHTFVLTHPQTTHTHKQAVMRVRTPPDPAWAKSGARFQPTCSLSPSPQEWGRTEFPGESPLLGSVARAQREPGEQGREREASVQHLLCAEPHLYGLSLVSSPTRTSDSSPRKCRPFGQDNTIICPALVSSPVSQTLAHLILSNLLKQALLLLLECATMLGPAPGPLHPQSPLPDTLLIPPHGSFFSWFILSPDASPSRGRPVHSGCSWWDPTAHPNACTPKTPEKDEGTR